MDQAGFSEYLVYACYPALPACRRLTSVSLYLAGVGPGIALKEQRWMAKDGLDRALLDCMVNAVVEALADGPLTRREIGSMVVARVGQEARPWVETAGAGSLLPELVHMHITTNRPSKRIRPWLIEYIVY